VPFTPSVWPSCQRFQHQSYFMDRLFQFNAYAL
jgi:hypothetical protein